MTLFAWPLLLIVGFLAWRFLYRAYRADMTVANDGPAECGNCGSPVAPFMGIRDRPVWVYCDETCALDHAETRQL